MVCNLCNSDLVYLLYRLSQGYKIMECRNCGLRFLFPTLSKENLYKIYEDGYFKTWGTDNGNDKPLTRLKELCYESVFKEVERFMRTGKLLDVGCAFGHSFDMVIKRGWDPYGVEISPEAYKIAVEKFPSKVILGDFLNVELHKTFFDLVVMVDFLEHTNHLMDAMSKAHDILKPKGLIAIITPDANSFSARLMRRNWPHIKLEHTFYFSPTTLKLLFAKRGFKPLILKRFWKPINFLYLKGQIGRYGFKYQFLTLKLFQRLAPDFIKRFNIYVPQGEIFALAEKI